PHVVALYLDAVIGAAVAGTTALEELPEVSRSASQWTACSFRQPSLQTRQRTVQPDSYTIVRNHLEVLLRQERSPAQRNRVLPPGFYRAHALAERARLNLAELRLAA